MKPPYKGTGSTVPQEYPGVNSTQLKKFSVSYFIGLVVFTNYYKEKQEHRRVLDSVIFLLDSYWYFFIYKIYLLMYFLS